MITHNYEITFFVINRPPKFNRTHWDYNLDGIPEKAVLDKRAEDIRHRFEN
ncbi:MAG: hypothetical protein LUH05_08195 [Candidatus Gastranaerophilales bacterium]|nr:hypothetical protein [Candidatus Gastranaerophilales bacterium]